MITLNKTIKISCGDTELKARLYENQMAENIWNSLPLSGKASTWGDEIYFSVPAAAGKGEKKAVVEVGELGYWEPGSAFCIFFGPTPASRGDEPRPADPVIVFGKVVGDASILKQVSSGTAVEIKRAD